MTALPNQNIDLSPVPVLPELTIVSPEIESSELSIRLLGSIAISEQPKNIFETLLHRSREYSTDDRLKFGQLMHTLIVSHVQSVNIKHGELPHARIIRPRRVTGLFSDIHRVFHEWQDRIPPQRGAKVYQEFIAEQTQLAHEQRKLYPEIHVVSLLAHDLHEISLPAGEVANELLAAYGMALRPDFVEKRMELMRHTENTDRMYT